MRFPVTCQILRSSVGSVGLSSVSFLFHVSTKYNIAITLMCEPQEILLLNIEVVLLCAFLFHLYTVAFKPRNLYRVRGERVLL